MWRVNVAYVIHTIFVTCLNNTESDFMGLMSLIYHSFMILVVVYYIIPMFYGPFAWDTQKRGFMLCLCCVPIKCCGRCCKNKYVLDQWNYALTTHGSDQETFDLNSVGLDSIMTPSNAGNTNQQRERVFVVGNKHKLLKAIKYTKDTYFGPIPGPVDMTSMVEPTKLPGLRNRTPNKLLDDEQKDDNFIINIGQSNLDNSIVD